MKGTRIAFMLGGTVLALTLLTLGGLAAYQPASLSAQGTIGQSFGLTSGTSVRNDTSPALRDIPPVPIQEVPEHEAAANPRTSRPHVNAPDPVVQRQQGPLSMPAPILNFDGIPYPGVSCNCAPPDTNGEPGATQYVQIVNEGYQVFATSTGASVFGPVSIFTIWSGFGGVCQSSGAGDPVVLYDQVAGRWLVSQFATTGGVPTDECIAVSTTSDATGSFNRYDFHLGSNFFDYPKLAVWPDAYYMADNVFTSNGASFLGPQPFAFDRSAMLAGQPATFVTTNGTLGSNVNPIIPADLDGSTLPASGAPETFLGWPGGGVYTTYHFHVDFANPANSTFGTFAAPAAAPFTEPCPTTRSCVPEQGVTSGNFLDAIGDRHMFRLTYRNFGDHESVVGNYTVLANGVTGIRWFEIRNVTAGPVTVYQESTYQPDTTWRWMGSAAMDQQGNLAVGYSASSSSISPQIRYAGRLVTDPLNTLGQGETTLFSGPGSQTGTANRWGDYSDLTIDPADDCTFWYTQEYYPTGVTSFNWRTRIGNFKFAGCGGSATPTPTSTSTATATPTPTGASSLTPTPTNTPTATPTPTGGSADLQTTKSGSLNKGHSQATYQIAVQNLGPNTATNVVMTDQLPSQLSFLSVSAGTGWTCSYNSSNHTITCSASSEASGASLGASIKAKVVTKGSITNCASATSSTPDPNPGNNTSCVTLTAAASIGAVTNALSNVAASIAPSGLEQLLNSLWNTLFGWLDPRQTDSN